MTLVGWPWDVTVCFFKGYWSFRFSRFLTVKGPELRLNSVGELGAVLRIGGKWMLWVGFRFPYRNQGRLYYCSAQLPKHTHHQQVIEEENFPLVSCLLLHFVDVGHLVQAAAAHQPAVWH